MIRVALVDDRQFSRAGIRAILESRLDLSVVAEGEVCEMSRMVNLTLPEVVLLNLPSHVDALPPLSRLRRLADPPATLVVTESLSDKGARELLALGVSGILVQESASKHLSWAVLAASQGCYAFSPEVSRSLILEYTKPIVESSRVKVAQTKIDTLSVRERQVLHLLSNGLQNSSIARTLAISPGTVKDHVRSICLKLKVENRFYAARIAWQAQRLTHLD